MREIVFSGKDYYWDSGTVMSCIYEKVGNKYERFDWGFFEIALGEGENIFVRQATNDEAEYFKGMLEKIKNLKRPIIAEAPDAKG